MSLFSDIPLELNFDIIPDLEESEETTEELEETTTDESEDSEKLNTTLSEDENPETVAEGEDRDNEGGDTKSPNLYSSFASVLSEKGLLPSLDISETEIKSIDDLTTALKSEITNQVKSYLVEKIGEKGYEAIEKGISLEEYQSYENNVNVLDNIDEDKLADNLDLAKRIILEDYISQGIEEKRAMRLLKKTVELGEESILEDAKESLQSLKVIQTKKLEQLQADREKQRVEQLKNQEKIDNDLKNTIYNTEEFITGIKADKNIKDKVYRTITTIVGKSPEGIAENKLMRDRRENPINFDSKLYYLYEVTNGFKDFSKLMNKSQSKALSVLEQQLRKTKFEDTGQPAYMQDPESYDGIGSELVL
jgi:hypothetical protein